MNEPEIVPPSDEPDAGVATGSGRGGSQGATPPPDNSASTSGLGPQSEQKGASAHGGAPLSLGGDDRDEDETNPTEPKSPSGT